MWQLCAHQKISRPSKERKQVQEKRSFWTEEITRTDAQRQDTVGHLQEIPRSLVQHCSQVNNIHEEYRKNTWKSFGNREESLRVTSCELGLLLFHMGNISIILSLFRALLQYLQSVSQIGLDWATPLNQHNLFQLHRSTQQTFTK